MIPLRRVATVAAILAAACGGSAAREEEPRDAEPTPVPAPAADSPTTDTPPQPGPDTSAATPPITPAEPRDPGPQAQADTPPDSAPQAQRDTPPAGTSKFSQAEYQGWRLYSVHCARCHGQDVLGNPVAPDLRRSAARGGAVASLDAFAEVVKRGRGAMPAFAGQLTDEQIAAIHAYVTGRAANRLPPGRPEAPAG